MSLTVVRRVTSPSEKYEEVTKDVSTYVERQISAAQKSIDEAFPSPQPGPDGEVKPADRPLFGSLFEDPTPRTLFSLSKILY